MVQTLSQSLLSSLSEVRGEFGWRKRKNSQAVSVSSGTRPREISETRNKIVEIHGKHAIQVCIRENNYRAIPVILVSMMRFFRFSQIFGFS